MGSIEQSPSIKTVSSHRERDTGFPESFFGTSLPHPEARLGADACITAEDVSVSRTRERRMFLGSKYKRTISHGRLMPSGEQPQHTMSAMYSDAVVVDSDADSPTLALGPFMTSRVASMTIAPGRMSKDSYEARSSSSAHGPKDEPSIDPPLSPSSTSSRNRGFLRKLGWHRN